MAISQMHHNAGLGLCLLVALATVSLTLKTGLDPGEGFDIGAAAANASSLMDQPAPEFALKNLKDETVSLKQQQGQVVLLNFWATWCGPCKLEMPHLQKFYDKYKEKGLVVLAVSTDKAQKAVPPFIEEHKYTFPVLYSDGTVESSYSVYGVPIVYLVDRQGAIRYKHMGYTPNNMLELEVEIRKLLDEKAPETPPKS